MYLKLRWYYEIGHVTRNNRVIGSNNLFLICQTFQTGLRFFTDVIHTLTLSSIFNLGLKISVPLEVKKSMYSEIHRAVVKIHTDQVAGCILHFTFAY